MNKTVLYTFVVLTSTINVPSVWAENAYIGHWALTLPNGGPGWLGVDQEDGILQANILWGGGSVRPVNSVAVENDGLVITRIQVENRGANKGKRITETITATLAGDQLRLVTVKTSPDGREYGRAEFKGQRTPPLPPRPDLSKVVFGEPIELLNGKDLSGWQPLTPDAAMGWSVEDGVLMNRSRR